MAQQMDTEIAAQCLESLGNTTRLEAFRLLVRAGDQGLPVGELQQRLSIPGSTLTHHLQHLVQRGLVIQQREGRVLRCCANYTAMTELISYLTEECCADGNDAC